METPHFHVDLKKLHKNLKRLQHEREVIKRAWHRAGKKATTFSEEAGKKFSEYHSACLAIENIYTVIRQEEEQHGKPSK